MEKQKKHSHNKPEKEKCTCQNCECEKDENKTNCECEDCNCEDNEHSCECEDCNCEDCDCEEETVSKEQEYLDSLLRLQAEFDNYRKRNEFVVIKAREEGVTKAVEKLLPVLDSFKSAEKHLEKNELKGLNLVKEQLMDSLKSLGVEEIEALNKPFDPNYHNAIMVGDEELKTQTVIEVFQEGYKLKDKVIRHSVVKISK